MTKHLFTSKIYPENMDPYSESFKQRAALAESLYDAIINELNYSLLETILDDYTYGLTENEVYEWTQTLEEVEDELE